MSARLARWLNEPTSRFVMGSDPTCQDGHTEWLPRWQRITRWAILLMILLALVVGITLLAMRSGSSSRALFGFQSDLLMALETDADEFIQGGAIPPEARQRLWLKTIDEWQISNNGPEVLPWRKPFGTSANVRWLKLEGSVPPPPVPAAPAYQYPLPERDYYVVFSSRGDTLVFRFRGESAVFFASEDHAGLL